jgi:hypothetical protein
LRFDVAFGGEDLKPGAASMSIWVSLYCQRRVGKINPPDLVAGIIDRLDYFSDLFAQEDPKEVVSRLNVEEIRGSDDCQLLHLYYLEDGPPIVIDRISNQDQVSGEIKEYLEESFQNRNGDEERLVQEHLGRTVENYHFCLKQRHADGMGTPLVYAAAALLGKQGNGLLRADEQGWMKLDGGEWFILCRE